MIDTYGRLVMIDTYGRLVMIDTYGRLVMVIMVCGFGRYIHV